MNQINNFCYVFDGVSLLFNDNLFSDTSDLYAYMNLLKENIVDIGLINDNFIEGINKSNKYFGELEKYKEYELPTFSIAAVNENEEDYELYLLCDCLISILYTDGRIENVEDCRFNLIKTKCRNEIAKIEELEISVDEKIKLKRKISKIC